MVYKFRMLSDEVKDFARDIEILGGQTFYDFHKAIQDDLGFDQSQIASFFLTNHQWEKEKEFTLFDMSDGESNAPVPMDKAMLKNYISELKQMMIYVFDFFNERSFFIELTEIQPEAPYSDYPAVTFSRGNPPQQILFAGNKYGSFSDMDQQGMDFTEDYSAISPAGLSPDDDEGFEDDLGEGLTENDPDAEPEE